MSREARLFYNHIRKQLLYVPNTSIAERLKKHILAHPNFNSSRNFLDLVVANYCTNRKKDKLPRLEVMNWLGKFLDVNYENPELFGGEEMKPEIIDNVNNPSHYQGRYGMESIDALRNFMTDEQLKGFFLGNSLKYLLRHQKKNGLEDLKKARKNLDWLIEELENEN